MIKKIGVAVMAVALLGSAVAQETPAPVPSPCPTPAARNIRISFVPPPLDGTISLAVYDARGKLVRVLFREADINEFTIGNDALSTTWDGKNDAGELVPAGKYSAHGFVVGDVKVEGVGFLFNDWITTADGPRFSRIRSLTMQDSDLLLAVDLVPSGQGHLLYNIADKSLTLKDTDSDTPGDASGSTAGREDTRWVIEQGEVKQLAANGEFLRRLPMGPDQPPVKAIAASLKEDKIYVLEENETVQRLRALSLVATKSDGGGQSVSEWKVDFEKSVVAHSEFSIVDGKVAAARGGAAPDKAKIRLMANPLLNDDRANLEVMVGIDADGSFLKAADGLPLCTISETEALRRALLNPRGSNTLEVFQDDGAVVEQFRVTGVDQIMSFDCGGFELK